MAQTKKSVAQSSIPKYRGVLQRKCACGQHTMGESECTECSKDKVALQRKPAGHNEPVEVPPIVHEVLRSSGQPLEAETRQLMESHFGEDFSKVRVHADSQAAKSARAVDALAYTVGRDVVFGHGQFASGTSAGQRLLAHELTHVVQQTSADQTTQTEPGIGAANNAAEREADDVAHSVITGSSIFGMSRFAGPQMQRQVVPGSVGWPGKGINAAKSTAQGIERIPLSGLGVGHQGGKGFSGKAIVLLSPTLDATKPVDVLVHFHGHNRGYEESGGTVRDDAIDNIEGQMASSSRPQLIGILPQGTKDSAFGETALPGKKSTKSFDADTYVNNVFGVLFNLGIWPSKPTVAGVMITGHSGAGELINEKILGSALGSNIGSGASPTAGSAAPKAFKELALFDAVNGPGEHARLYEFLQMKMTDELAKVQQGTDSERVAYLRRSFKFRAYFSHSPKIGNYYSQWHVGPVVHPKAIYKVSIQDLITKFLKTAAPALGGTSSPVYQAFEANYRVIDAGAAVDHDKMVSSSDHLKDAISVLPKRESEFLENDPAIIPRSVYETLQSSGRPLDSRALAWANDHFGHDMSGVRIHDDNHAADSARSIRAQAYTAGRDIVFGKGRYAPATEAGRRLLAHELTHVIQQGEKPAGSNLEIGPRRDSLEVQADRAADSASAVNIAQSFSGRATSVRLQRAPDDQPKTVDAAMCEANANPEPAVLGTCNYKEPANCPTYEGWISTFTLLKTFDAKDTPGAHPTGNKVFGGVAASKDFRPVSKDKEPGAAPAPGKAFPRLKAGERFIDHPTDEWVKTCLPETLRATAYQLPADCADIAMILRHVWLAAHNRTQKFGDWTLGSAAGKAEEKNVLNVITAEGTQGVSNLVAPYSDAQGKPLRSIKDLAPLLHTGDILVWWHYEHGFDKPHTGGHTHTIAAVEREESGALKDLTLLQGNEPLFSPQKKDIQDFLKAENPKQKIPTFDEMGVAPGRRIEEAKASAKDTGLKFIDSDPKTDKSPAPIWQWGDETLLVVAGPPKAAPRPAMKTVEKKTVRRLSDWIPSFQKAAVNNLFDVFEAALFEARAMIEGGQRVSDDDARGLGEAAGQMVWRLAKKSKDLGEESHFKVVKEMRAMLAAMRGSSNQPVALNKPIVAGTSRFELVRLFGVIDEAFQMAARGAADIKFSAPGVKPERVVKTLLTGFDPVNTAAPFNPPRAGEWNPSGAAVMAMDGKTIKLEKGAVAALEGIVLPTDYKEFGAGMVEKMVKPYLGTVDALLTVSLDSEKIQAGGPVRLERYAVGAHLVEPATAAKGAGTGKTDYVVEPVAAAKDGGVGKEIIKTEAPLEQIAKETAKPADKSSPGVQEPTIGENITFMFSSVAEADNALKALGLPAKGSIEVSIGDAAALKQISDSMTRDDKASPLSITKGGKKIRLDGPAIKFKAGGKEFHAFVYSGPGGNFLSNEATYRVLRLLAETKSAKDPISFHTHTEQGNLIPQDTSTPAATKARSEALKKGMSIRDKLVSTLTRMIQSVGKIIMGRR